MFASNKALADESSVSFWVPGLFGSLAASAKLRLVSCLEKRCFAAIQCLQLADVVEKWAFPGCQWDCTFLDSRPVDPISRFPEPRAGIILGQCGAIDL